MPKLLLGSDDEGDGSSSKPNSFTINESYATAYERWRRKEEYQKLKDKYGEDILSEDSVVSADDDDDDDDESDESESTDVDETIFDQKFLKVYGALKSRDPNIYDENVRFFDDDDDNEDEHTASTDGGMGNVGNDGNVGIDDDGSSKTKKKKKKDKGMNLLDYHVNLVKKEKGMTEEDRLMEMGEQSINPKNRPDKASYVQEMESIKKEFKNILADDDNDDDGGELIKGVKKIPVQERKPDPSDILRDASKNDKRIGFLANYWDKKDLDDREQFLKEYILQKKYLDPSDTEGGISMTSILSSQSKSTANETVSSSKYAETDANANESGDDSENGDDEQKGMQISSKLSKINEKAAAYHYQESNAEVIKRYPREVESVRNLHGPTTRNVKRSEIKERKAKEKAEGLQRFRELRRAEVKAKLEKLKEISGNDRLLLEDKKIDIDAIVDDITNFDPEKYDECMSKLFDEQFYDVSSANPHRESDMQKPKFDFIPGIDDVDDNLNPIGQGEGSSAEAAEEEDIDGDVYDEYDDEDDFVDADVDDGPSTSKGKKKKKKENKKKTEKEPAEKKNIGIYEDLIGGEVPTRFKYRQVPPNDFGLSPEELLLADDKELNRWVSLKKTCQHRTIEEEKYDIKVYGRKATDYALKKKILKSVYNPEAATDEADNFDNDDDEQQQQNQSKEPDTQAGPSTSVGATLGKKSNKRRRNEGKELESINLTEDRLRSYDLPFRAIKKLKGRLHQGRRKNQSKRK